MRKFLANAKFLASAGAATAFFAGTSARADQPVPWETTFQAPATDMMRQIESFGALHLKMHLGRVGVRRSAGFACLKGVRAALFYSLEMSWNSGESQP